MLKNELDGLQIALGIIYNSQGDILLTQRATHKHQGGLWEFPGGKRENPESIEQALYRELGEELGIETQNCTPLIHVFHDYGDIKVCLHVYQITHFLGEPQGLEDQPLCWVSPDKLSQYALPKANDAIIKAINLPKKYWITEWVYDSDESLYAQIESVLQQGIKLIQLRLKKTHIHLIQTIVERCHTDQCKVLVNTSSPLVKQIEGVGVHLTSKVLSGLKNLDDYANMLVGASCHNAQQLKHAEQLGVDFALLSPVLKTKTHPEAEPLGWNQFAKIIQPVNLPVYALGGMNDQLLAIALSRGAQGIAGIRQIVHTELIR